MHLLHTAVRHVLDKQRRTDIIRHRPDQTDPFPLGSSVRAFGVFRGYFCSFVRQCHKLILPPVSDDRVVAQ
jgi:hypothetical protein